MGPTNLILGLLIAVDARHIYSGHCSPVTNYRSLDHLSSILYYYHYPAVLFVMTGFKGQKVTFDEALTDAEGARLYFMGLGLTWMCFWLENQPLAPKFPASQTLWSDNSDR
jgi:hypothetical protein